MSILRGNFPFKFQSLSWILMRFLEGNSFRKFLPEIRFWWFLKFCGKLFGDLLVKLQVWSRFCSGKRKTYFREIEKAFCENFVWAWAFENGLFWFKFFVVLEFCSPRFRFGFGLIVITLGTLGTPFFWALVSCFVLGLVSYPRIALRRTVTETSARRRSQDSPPPHG